MKFEDKKIILEHGFIEIVVAEKGSEYCNYSTIEFEAGYERKEYDVFKYNTFDSLHYAYEWYKKIDLDMRGI